MATKQAPFEHPVENAKPMKTKGSATPKDKLIGKRIKDLRIRKGLTQSDLAKNLNVTFQQLQKYEQGTNRISATNLFDLAQSLSVPLNYFYQDIDSAFVISDNEQSAFGYASKDELNTLNRLFQSIQSASKRKKILEYLKKEAKTA